MHDSSELIADLAPWIKALMADGRLVAPFRPMVASQRGYLPVRSAGASSNPAAGHFADWIASEVALSGATAPP